jgi:hypothetical protein
MSKHTKELHLVFVYNIGMFINPLPANVDNMALTNVSKWRMGYNSAFKGLRM